MTYRILIVLLLVVSPIYYLYHIYKGDVKVEHTVIIKSKSIVMNGNEKTPFATLSDNSNIVISNDIYVSDNLNKPTVIMVDNPKLLTEVLIFGLIELFLCFGLFIIHLIHIGRDKFMQLWYKYNEK